METFLVRVWVPSEPIESESTPTLQGLAQHVRSGVATAFTESEQLCDWLGAMAAEQRGGGQAREGGRGEPSRGG